MVEGEGDTLTKFTADALIITTTNNIAASKYLIATHNFQYILSAEFSQNPLERFFEQGRQRNSGIFYIDIVDVIAAGKAQRIHQLIKYDITPQGETIRPCTFCNAVVDEEGVEMLHEITIEDTQTLVNYLYSRFLNTQAWRA